MRMKNMEEFPLLVAQGGVLKGRRWSLDQPLVIGREPHCDVIIEERQVSRFHARLTPSAEGVILEDLGSKNGTHNNGNLITNPVVLKDGDVIQIAVAQKFIFLSSDATMPLTERLEGQRRLRIDSRSRRVWVMNQQLLPSLSALQFQFLQILYDNQGEVVTRIDLVNAIWGSDQAGGVTDQAVDALVRRVRDRLAAVDPSHPYITTVRGQGLRLDNPIEEENKKTGV